MKQRGKRYLSKEDILDIHERMNSKKELQQIIADEYNINVRYAQKIMNKLVRKECFECFEDSEDTLKVGDLVKLKDSQKEFYIKEFFCADIIKHNNKHIEARFLEKIKERK